MQFFSIICWGLVLFFECSHSVWAKNSAVLFHTSAPFGLVMSADSGEIVLDKNSDALIVPSSMTKLLTLYILFNSVRKGHFHWDSSIFVSLNAAKKEGSRMMLIPNQNVLLKDLLLGIIVCSGNDASTAFAEAFSGDESHFAEHMNQVARALGAKKTCFMNASGLPHPNHKTTCKDLACIAHKIFQDFPEYYSYFKLKEFTFNKIRQWTKNLLVRKGMADGMKTGKTEAGGYGIVASAQRDGQRFIVVLNGMKTEQERFHQASALLNWAFHRFRTVKLFKMNSVVKEIPVLGLNKKIGLYTPKPIAVCVPKHQLKDVKIKIIHYNGVRAPVRKGTLLGELQIFIPEKPQQIFGLYSDQDVILEHWWKKILYKIGI
ncbi:D-alanyl-D-alanine carboxypeptidase DacC [Holospora obtusa F1]|uniref:serine-type D-Ala-D-Ala carboxypeptidase n=1 Tax=Holospora obtusa F1 TaxID=1399147 RepID=W6THW3_HOLOB|nr:D-alanyl-D-alanine carboxypeptidase family protein [Holospora obtusa]ETZ07565.1 D-alanyl-D-alanine carboxypeptidase DacC [Holospora obtusa F1]